MVWLLIFTIFLASDTVEVKGTNGISYRTLVNQDTLYFQYKINHKWSEPTIIDNGDVGSPSMAISSGNYLHIVWCKQGGVYYRTTLQPITKNSIKKEINQLWSSKIKISTHMAQTEPASDLFIEARGDTVLIEWQSSGELGDNKEIWRRKRRILDPYYEWFQPVNFTLVKDIEPELK